MQYKIFVVKYLYERPDVEVRQLVLHARRQGLRKGRSERRKGKLKEGRTET